jgi:hypothetical protein
MAQEKASKMQEKHEKNLNRKRATSRQKKKIYQDSF